MGTTENSFQCLQSSDLKLKVASGRMWGSLQFYLLLNCKTESMCSVNKTVSGESFLIWRPFQSIGGQSVIVEWGKQAGNLKYYARLKMWIPVSCFKTYSFFFLYFDWRCIGKEENALHSAQSPTPSVWNNWQMECSNKVTWCRLTEDKGIHILGYVCLISVSYLCSGSA